jgi:site-specific recombinase XerD
MPKLKLTVLKSAQQKDGTNKIRIAINHQGKTAHLVTRYAIDSPKQWKNGKVVGRPDAANMNLQLSVMLHNVQVMLDNINHVECYTCVQIRRLLNAKKERAEAIPTFQYVAEKYIAELRSEKRENYAKLMERNLRYFSEGVSKSIMLQDITPMEIAQYEHYLRRCKKVNETTINMMLSRTRTIINRGIKSGLVQYGVHPFAQRKIRASAVRELDLEIENVAKIEAFQTTAKKYIVARDLFMLSFYLGGINLVDLLAQTFEPGKTTLEYERTKTSGTAIAHKIVVPILPEAQAIIDRWRDKRSGKLNFGYKFTYSNFYRYLTRTLTAMEKLLDIDQHIVFYSARKSFAQFASEIGIPDAVIDYVLGHSDKSRGVIRHYTKVKQRQAEVCVKRVVDYLHNPEQYQDYIDMKMDIMVAGHKW